jgi:tryptophan-rich sensory protein
MPDWVIALEKPWWYPGDAIWSNVNQMFVAVYVLFSLLYLVVFYRIIKGDWPWTIAVPFIINILTTFFFVVIAMQFKVLLPVAIDIFVMYITMVWGLVMVYRRSRWLAALGLPYAIWLTVFMVMYAELLRLNTFA